MKRREFLATTATLCGAPFLVGSNHARCRATQKSFRLSAAATRQHLFDAAKPQTAVWAYNSSVPGPLIRCTVGERLDLPFSNRLPEPTTVHWHGMRVPNGMDGVPNLTQPPVPRDGSFHYSFKARNSGTYWYHPHFKTSEQQDRGLHGVIVVEETAPPAVDRELVWALDDWRLNPKAQIVEDFGDLHDASHSGRMGNTATINGKVPSDLRVRRGERIRLRLVNVANAWIFGLDFQGHAPKVIAYDGHATKPHTPPGGLVIVGPSQRVDLILDMTGQAGKRFEIVDRFYSRNSYKLLDLVYADDNLRNSISRAPLELPPPELPAADLAKAQTHRLSFSGGAMGRMRSAHYQNEETTIRDLFRQGKMWAINGVVAATHNEAPMLQLKLGKSYLLEFINETRFTHPIHLHGHPMRVLEANGSVPPQPIWRDSLLLQGRKSAKVAIVADNPGLWMLHCHIPEHQEAGMMSVVEVA